MEFGMVFLVVVEKGDTSISGNILGQRQMKH